MAEDSAMYHEPLELVPQKTRELHRAIVSVIEELQAIDWYAQRADATEDPELRALLVHNGNEEKEHAAMLLEWIRRQDPAFEAHLRRYLFHDGRIVPEDDQREAAGDHGRAPLRPSIGSLREVRP
jgi:ferritin-like protein